MKDYLVNLLLGESDVTPKCIDIVGTVFGDNDVTPKVEDSVGPGFGDSDVRPKAVDSVGTVFGLIAGVGVSSENLVYYKFSIINVLVIRKCERLWHSSFTFRHNCCNPYMCR